MKKCFLERRIYLLIFICFNVFLANAQEFVTIQSPGAGRLSVNQTIWHTASKLKIKGNINAVDFNQIKKMPALRELDLSEANIVAYSGKKGCFDPVTSDWFVDENATYHEYPANYFPIHAFTVLRDNSFKKWHEGSKVLRKIILPNNLLGIEADAFKGCTALEEFAGSGMFGAVKAIDGVLYSADIKTLLACPPKRGKVLEIPASVTAIADNALQDCQFPYLKFNSLMPPSLGNNKVVAAYIEAPTPNEYKKVFLESDVVDKIKQISVVIPVGGTLLDALAQQGVLREDIRSLRITGSINKTDWNWLKELPHLYYLDLQATDITTFPSACPAKLCGIVLPSGLQNTLGLYGNHLTGKIVLPQKVATLSSKTFANSLVNEVEFNTSLISIGEGVFENSSIQKVDLSKCLQLTLIGNTCFSNCNQLDEIVLPPNLIEIGENSFSFIPIKSLVLPRKLNIIGKNSFDNTAIERLEISENLKEINNAFSHSSSLVHINCNNAKNLIKLSGFSGCPLLKEVDLSTCYKLKSLEAFNSSEGFELDNSILPAQTKKRSPNRFVVIGGSSDYGISGLRRIVFAPNLEEINGFLNCYNIQSLDFSPCFRLKVINGFKTCKNLKEIILPGNIQDLSYAFLNSDSLKRIVCPAINVPSVSNALPFARITLEVPIGTRGKYVLNEKWSSSAQIIEKGYCVNLSSVHPQLPEAVYPLITGLGLYAPKTAVTLNAIAPANFKFQHWTDSNGKVYPNPSITFVIEGNMNLEAYFEYTTEGLTPNVEIDIVAQKDTVIGLNFAASSYPLRVEYDNNQYTYINSDDLRNLFVHKGHSTIRIFGDLNDLYMNGYNNPNVKAIDIRFNDCANLSFLDASWHKLKELDLSGITGLYGVDCSFNEIEKLKLPLGIKFLVCSSNKLDNLELPYPELATLYCGYNNFNSINLTACKSTLVNLNINGILMDELDLSAYNKLRNFSANGCKLKHVKFNPNIILEFLDVNSNLLETLDIPSCKSLAYVDIENNKFAFSAITPELYRAITQNETMKVDLEFAPFDAYLHHVALPVDLSKELYTAQGQIQTQYEWRSLNCPTTEYQVVSPGVFKFDSENVCSLKLRNAQMPLLSFYTNVHIGNFTDIPSLGDDSAVSIEVVKQIITIKGIEAGTPVQLLSVNGALLQNEVASENNTCVLNPGLVGKGVYLIRIIGKQGRIKTHKVLLGTGS